MSETADRQRIDKWLWHARFFKTRGLSAKLVTGGHMRVNGQRISKASHAVSPGDVLTFAKDHHIRLIRVLAIGQRRGPAPEAQALYEDLDPPQPRERTDPAPRTGGRPTKQDRRALDRLRGDA